MSNLPLDERIQALFEAVDQMNDAWADVPRKVSLWIDWRERKVVVQIRDMACENHSRASLLDALERRQIK